MEISFSNGTIYSTDEAEKPLLLACKAVSAPVMFGCRIGICGTCKVYVSHPENISPKTKLEKEFTETDNERLACQCYVYGDTHVAQSKE